jgi:16S rRNA (adenine1518-N6/adenine1519-N6)-dimethyltransferase
MHIFKRSLGQNFLQDPLWAKKMISAIDINSDDLVIEIGPGQGIVTAVLAKIAAKVYSIEFDPALIPGLKENFKGTNVEVIEGDILTVDLPALINGRKFKAVGSLPYNISKKIIADFLMLEPDAMAFIVQKEVAEKYTDLPPDASFLANYAGIYSDVKYIETIPKLEFYPEPKVDGAILAFTNIKPKYPDAREFSKFIRSGFSQPRKKLSANLANIGYNKGVIEAIFKNFGQPEGARAQNLTLENWRTLYDTLQKVK